MTCSLTLSSTDVAAGRIAARHRARIAHLRAGRCAVAGAHADGFASMLLFVLQLQSAEKPKNSSRISRVTLFRWNRNLFFAVAKSAAATCARTDGCPSPTTTIHCPDRNKRVSLNWRAKRLYA